MAASRRTQSPPIFAAHLSLPDKGADDCGQQGTSGSVSCRPASALASPAAYTHARERDARRSRHRRYRGGASTRSMFGAATLKSLQRLNCSRKGHCRSPIVGGVAVVCSVRLRSMRFSGGGRNRRRYLFLLFQTINVSILCVCDVIVLCLHCVDVYVLHHYHNILTHCDQLVGVSVEISARRRWVRWSQGLSGDALGSNHLSSSMHLR